MALGLISL